MATNFKVKFVNNFDEIIEEVDDLFLKQIPFAAMLTLNETVFKAMKDARKNMPSFIEGGPTPFTKRGVQFKGTKNKRKLVGKVFIPDAQWKYMQWVVDGGNKQWSKSRFGISVPNSKNNKFNKYGNIPGKKRKEKVWRDVLNQMGGDVMAPRGKLPKNQFIGTINGTTGLWKRMGKGGRSKLKLLMNFTKEVIPYKRKYPFVKFTSIFMNVYFQRQFGRKLKSVIMRESDKLKVR